MYEGKNGNFYWLSSTSYGIAYLAEEKLMNVLKGQRLIISSFDSGSFIPTEEEKRLGWYSAEKLAISPPIEEGLSIPFAGYDEWWVIRDTRALSSLHTFGNYSGFLLRSISDIRSESDQSWDKQIVESKVDVIDHFWQQVEEISPIVYLANCDNFNLVTTRVDFFDAVKRSVTKVEKGEL